MDAPNPARILAHRRGFGHIQDWEADAACQGTDLSIWFGDADQTRRSKEQTAQAKAICASCSVLDACRDWAITSRIPFGFVGGMNERERIRERKRRAIPQRHWHDDTLGDTRPRSHGRVVQGTVHYPD
jgi:WhiB family redox-sensing transcriptional regulator